VACIIESLEFSEFACLVEHLTYYSSDSSFNHHLKVNKLVFAIFEAFFPVVVPLIFGLEIEVYLNHMM
jgi:hypothetical protein